MNGYNLTFDKIPERVIITCDGVILYDRTEFSKPSLKLNLPSKGTINVHTNVNLTAHNKGPKITYSLPRLPRPDHYYKVEKLRLETNPDLVGTPARITPGIGLVEIMPGFDQIPVYEQAFILAHEFAHHLQEKEPLTDIRGLYYYLLQGYPPSAAFKALKEHLRRTPENIDRLKQLFKYSYHADNNQS